jgi:hypothetical protein
MMKDSRERIFTIFDKVELELREQPSLFLDKSCDVKFDNLEEFLKMFLSTWSKDFPTVYENGKLQCGEGKSRTASDIYRIVISYIPETRFSEVMAVLYNYVKEGHINTYKCPNIDARVWFTYFRGWTSNCIYNFTTNIRWWAVQTAWPDKKVDEFGLLPEDYVECFEEYVKEEYVKDRLN